MIKKITTDENGAKVPVEVAAKDLKKGDTVQIPSLGTAIVVAVRPPVT